ncbi:MAG: type III pantothenate kinase, partial [Proteobacteria bacterium]|nr:type III pantothenate kinase [Pseudomonadota bacterium]
GGLTNCYQPPESLGVDRFLTALAAYQRLKQACCVIDFGSAITFDVIDVTGQLLGGYILPGTQALSQGLSARASLTVPHKLPSDFLAGIPDRTSGAIEQGIMHLVVGGCDQNFRTYPGRR